MNIKTFFRDTRNISKVTTVIIFLALIRSISEPLRLQYFSKTTLTYDDIKPFLIGSLIASTGLLVMTISFYFSRHKLVIATCILVIISLLIVKATYLIP